MHGRIQAALASGPGRLAAAGLVVALVGCGGETTGPGPGPGPVPTIATVQVTPGTGTVAVGGTVQLFAVAKTVGGATVSTTFTWSSENTNLAEVAANGIVTGKADGTVKITATAGGKSGEAMIKVEQLAPAPAIVGFSPATAAAGGPDLTLTVTGTGFRPDVRLQWDGAARPTEYVSATVARATIWAADLATARTAMVQMVNAASGGASAAVAFEIVPQLVPVATVELSRALAYTVVGAAVPMAATVRDQAGAPLSGRLVTWASSNQLVAVVNGAGLVQPVGVGEVTITATSEGRSATLALTVGTRVTHLMLDDGSRGLASLDLRIGDGPVLFWQLVAGSRVSDPSVSPDGRWVAHTIEMGGVPTLGVLDLASRTYRFLPTDAPSDQPAWSPVAGRIAFRKQLAGRADVWVMNDDGTGAVNLTASMPQGWQAGWPAWSPDGTRIVFSAGMTPDVRTLYVMRADGTGLQPILFSSHMDVEPAWHGDAIAFTRRRQDGTSDIFRIPVGGGALVQLTQSGQASMPAWAPDGRWIAFADGAGAVGGHDILAVRPFAEEIRPLSLRLAGGGGRNPTWLTHQ